MNYYPFFFTSFFITLLLGCHQNNGKLSRKQAKEVLVIGGMSQKEINEQLKIFKDVEKLIISKEVASGWSVYPPREADDPIFDQVPRMELSPAIGELTQLKSLNLLDLSLTSLPNGISKLTQLDTLNLALNYLTISEELNKLSPLKKMRYLDLKNNRVDSVILKKWMADKPGLTVIY